MFFVFFLFLDCFLFTMNPDLQVYDNGELLMVEFECDSNEVPNIDALQVGATVLVSNEEDGIVNYDDLTKFFDMSTARQIETEYAVERTLADPALKQILEEANDKVDFDPEAEQEKLREFLSGVTSSTATTATTATTNSNSMNYSV